MALRPDQAIGITVLLRLSGLSPFLYSHYIQPMYHAKHCRLCQHQVIDEVTGTLCGLTQAKPNFAERCPTIEFGEKQKEVIKEVNIEYELVKRTKSISLGNLFFFLAISLAFMIAGYLIGTYVYESGVISTVPLIIMGVGFLVLPLAFGPMNKYRQHMGVARKKKKELDDLLAQYNTKYNIEVIVNKDRHGNQEVDTKLTFDRKYYR